MIYKISHNLEVGKNFACQHREKQTEEGAINMRGVIDITTAPSPNPATIAILSIADSVSSTPPTCPGGTVNLVGLTIEQPPTQTAGGGLNSTLTTNTVTIATPLANGASINVNFMTNVVVSGTFKFFINVEALP